MLCAWGIGVLQQRRYASGLVRTEDWGTQRALGPGTLPVLLLDYRGHGPGTGVLVLVTEPVEGLQVLSLKLHDERLGR